MTNQFIHGDGVHLPHDQQPMSFSQSVSRKWSPSTYNYYRRVVKRERKMSLEEALTKNVTPENGLEEHNFYLPRVTDVLEAQPTKYPEILAGYYMPDYNQTALAAQNKVDDVAGVQQPNRVNACDVVVMNPSADVTLNEQPTGNQVVAVDMELVRELQSYAMFKPRDTDLIVGIKNKALQMLRSKENTSEWKHHQLAMATSLAFVPSEAEKLAIDHMRCPSSMTNINWVNNVLAGGDKSLIECRTLKPKLVTRFLDWLYAGPGKSGRLPVNP